MDLLGFAAFGGMERVAIIAGALLIGYWGYRLYAGGKAAGLAFLGIACIMLFGALLTGGSHVRSVGAGIQLASAVKPPLPSVAEAQESVATIEEEPPAATAADPAAETSMMSAEEPTEASGAESAGADAILSDTAATAAAGTAASAVSASGTPRSGVPAADASAADAIRRLATAQELGGRIVAVKSDNVSLEWSAPESER